MILEGEPGNYSAYVPDLPGCITVGETIEEIRVNIHEAVTLFLEETVKQGQCPPKPSTQALMVSAA